MTGFVYSSLALISLGFAWFLIARSTKTISSEFCAFLVQLVGIPFLVFMIPFTDNNLDGKSLTQIVLVGIFESFVMIALFYAMKVGNSGIVLPITDGYALITSILGIALLGEKSTTTKLLGLLILVLGIFFLSINLSKRIELNKGVLWAFVTALGNGLFFFFVGLLSDNASWLVVALGIRITITITFIPILFLRKVKIKKELKNIQWFILAPGAVLDAIGFSLYNLALARSDVGYSTLMISGQSVIIVILSYFVSKEKVTKLQIAGLMLALAGLLLIQL